MKKHFYLLCVLMFLLFISANAQAQSERSVYLKSDELFKNIAADKLEQTDKVKLENFGQAVENDLTLKDKREKQAANLLIAFQNNPEQTALGYYAMNPNTASQQKALQANKLFTEYTLLLIAASPSGEDDPLKELLNKLKSSDGQRILNADLEIRLGQGVEREDRAAELFSEMKVSLSAENLSKLRSKLKVEKVNMTAGAVNRLPYPLCLLSTSNCPKKDVD